MEDEIIKVTDVSTVEDIERLEKILDLKEVRLFVCCFNRWTFLTSL